ncbi:hypothetical protein C8Q80DRAFT_1199240 [Daedaleopsis nitida]|nr:hypothetical protein C8Q80DRAFT_1199240 [Daedaleopsis nitida]
MPVSLCSAHGRDRADSDRLVKSDKGGQPRCSLWPPFTPHLVFVHSAPPHRYYLHAPCNTQTMRFLSLTTLFHRRARSDPDIHRLASTPYAFPEAETRPVSTDCIFDLALPPSSSLDIDAFAAYACASAPSIDTALSSLPTLTLAYSHHEHQAHSLRPPGTNTSASSSTTTLSYPPSVEYPPNASHFRPPDPVEHHPHSILAILTERIQDLETALLEECEANACIPELQDALGAERRARDAAEQANAGLVRKVAVLHDEVLQLRRVLFSAIASGGQPARNPDPEVAATTTAERDRLRHFFDLMVSVGAHRPVIDAGYQGVVQGEDAEAAVVLAIRSALEQPESVWRQLLEPVTGPRTPAEYMAQVRCTLRARREVRVWRWKAGFWKGKAREDGRCEETVTPSASKVEEVVEGADGAVPEERMARVEEMMVKLNKGELPLRVQYMSSASQEVDVSAPMASASAATAAGVLVDSSSSGTQAEIDAMAELVDVVPPSWPIDDLERLPATSSSMVLPSASTTRISSIAIRQNSNGSNIDVPISASGTLGASCSVSLCSVASPSRCGSRMTSSDSMSTTTSVKSRRRRAKVLTVPCVTVAVAPSESLPSDAAAEPTVLVASPTDQGVSPSPHSQETLPAFGSLPRALVDFGEGSDEDLVLVLSTDFSDTSYHATSPGRESADSKSTLPGCGETGSGSPGLTADVHGDPVQDKKSSRLPVRMPGMKVIKRLSASIANAGSRNPGAGEVGAVDVNEKLKSGRLGRSRALSMGPSQTVTQPRRERGRSPTMPMADIAAEPARQSAKIPMGKRLQRFGLGGSTEGRK